MKKNARGMYPLQIQLDRRLAMALQRYAQETGRTYAGIVRIALQRMIPQRFFDNEGDDEQTETAA